MSTLIFAFILLFASFNLPINGRNLAKDNNTETTSQGEVEAITENRRLGIKGSNFISPFTYQPADYVSWDTIQGEWHGANAKISLWGTPNIQPQSHSEVYIAAFNYDGTSKDAIAAGVHVFPSLYGDDDVHFFTYWTNDYGNPTASCYNTQCPGFVLADGANLGPGYKMSPLSTYGGQDYYITIRIKKDEETGDWSLYRADQGGPIGGAVLLGWWPKTLFTGLANFATKIEFKAGVFYHVNETSPPMGSGHFPYEGEGKAAYMKNIFAYDNNGYDYELTDDDVTKYIDADADECYKVSDWLHQHWTSSHYFYYGGPSGCKV